MLTTQIIFPPLEVINYNIIDYLHDQIKFVPLLSGRYVFTPPDQFFRHATVVIARYDTRIATGSIISQFITRIIIALLSI